MLVEQQNLVEMNKLLLGVLIAFSVTVVSCHGSAQTGNATADSAGINGKADSTPADATQSTNSTTGSSSSIRGSSDTTHTAPPAVKEQAKDSLPGKK